MFLPKLNEITPLFPLVSRMTDEMATERDWSAQLNIVLSLALGFTKNPVTLR
jgi:hypothetical protein